MIDIVLNFINLTIQNIRYEMKSLLYTLLVFISIIIVSCSIEDDDQAKKDAEKKYLDEYISKNNLSDKLTSSGIYYIEKNQGTGISPVENDFILFDFDMSLLNGGHLIQTTDTALAVKNEIISANYLNMPYYAQLSIINGKGMREGLKMMKEGGSAELIIPSAYAYGDYEYKNIPAYSTIKMFIKLEKVIRDPVTYDRNMINGWLDTLGLAKADSTKNGVYIKIDSIGDGSKLAEEGDSVYYSYRARLLNGKYVNGTTQYTKLKSILGKSNDLKPIAEAIKLLKKGGKARIIVPYTQSLSGIYGTVNSNYQVTIPIYSSQLYDLTLDNVVKLSE